MALYGLSFQQICLLFPRTIPIRTETTKNFQFADESNAE